MYAYSNHQGVSPAELSRMKERLAQVEAQVRRTQMEFTDKVTLHNTSGRNLHLTLNISEGQRSTADRPPDAEELTLSSSFNLPNNSVISHQFTRQGRGYFDNYDSNNKAAFSTQDRSNQFPQAGASEIHQSAIHGNHKSRSPQRNQQKFQSLGPRNHTKHQEEEKSDEIKIEDEESDVAEESKIDPFSVSDLKPPGPHLEESTPNKKDASLTFGDIQIPSSLIPKQKDNSESISASPQVLSYLHQQFRKDQPEINTSIKQKPNTTLKLETPAKKNQKLTSNSKNKLNNLLSNSNHSDKKLNQLINTPKTYENRQGDISTHKPERKRQTSNSKPIAPNQSNKIRAEQLFKKRKQDLFNNSNQKDISNHSRNVNDRFNRFVTQTRNRTDRSQSRTSLSPKVQAVTERLCSKQKSPCGHYRRFSESQERARFHFLVEQNPLVKKYLAQEQKEELFQKLRNDPDSVSLWPMKLVNYTSAKLKKSASVNYHVLLSES